MQGGIASGVFGEKGMRELPCTFATSLDARAHVSETDVAIRAGPESN
ncbi:hypothetical protein AG1IA_06245 [Rhizoctonia solani AG-1 IA]|uniref:Uncharacterized protein n=1 Tax=Thanatephorus cucumeris (strain AG1-IA) TaxID=983506 RepID=L8WSL0_THACA|nr:hypothetical protein AG1IA_06245 [Rhizoctonia solani AG-1 IA]